MLQLLDPVFFVGLAPLLLRADELLNVWDAAQDAPAKPDLLQAVSGPAGIQDVLDTGIYRSV